MLGVFATALFYGDSMITPAISVLSAVEGLTTVQAGFEPYVIPIAIGILVGLFAIQSRGTAKVGLLFGPIMLVYFVTIAVLGVMHIVEHPAVHPGDAQSAATRSNSSSTSRCRAFIAMGSVVLAVTGAEALYADMGHFGRQPDQRFAGSIFVMPALLLNYMGQGAMLLSHDPAEALETVKNPFFFLAPEMLPPAAGHPRHAGDDHRQPGGDLGRLLGHPAGDPARLHPAPPDHATPASMRAGQIYIPVVNWALMVMVILLVLIFQHLVEPRRGLWHRGDRRDADRQLLIAVVLFTLWKWNRRGWPSPLLAHLLHRRPRSISAPTCSRCPTAAGSRCWSAPSPSPCSPPGRKGRKLMIDRMNEASLPIEVFIKSAATSAARVPGTAVFMTTLDERRAARAAAQSQAQQGAARAGDAADRADRGRALSSPDEQRIETKDYGAGFFRIILRYGFMEEIDVPAALAQVKSMRRRSSR